MADIKYYWFALKAEIGILIAIIAAFLFPIKALIAIVFLFIILDTITGVIRVFKKKEGFTIRKFCLLISKLILYNSTLISIFILEKYLLGEFVLIFSAIPLLLTKICAAWACGREIMSINRNVTKISGINMYKNFRDILFRVKNVKDDIKDLVDTDDTAKAQPGE